MPPINLIARSSVMNSIGLTAPLLKKVWKRRSNGSTNTLAIYASMNLTTFIKPRVGGIVGREIDLLVNYPETRRNVEERGADKTDEDRRIARQFGKDFFDGDR